MNTTRLGKQASARIDVLTLDSSALGLVYRNSLFDASNSWSCKGSARGIGNPDVDGLSRSNVASGGEA
jgi:hypothetical protein